MINNILNLFLEEPNKMDPRIPLVPSDLVGKEPTLIELLNFVKEEGHPENLSNLLNDKENRQKSIKQRLTTEIELFDNEQSFYLYGQLKINVNDKLTSNLLQKSIEKNNQQMKDCPPAHQMDIWSAENAMKIFSDLLKVIELFYHYHIDIYYAPGGQGFLDAKERFEKKIF